jgi:hypothetical protein
MFSLILLKINAFTELNSLLVPDFHDERFLYLDYLQVNPIPGFLTLELGERNHRGRYSLLKSGERFGGLDEGLVSRERRAIREKEAGKRGREPFP